MAFKLERERTNTAPYVLIDEERCYMKFEGKCYLEDILSFFKDINEWLEKHLASDSAELTFDCAMEYFNSSTTKLLYNMMRMLDKSAGKGAKIVINWIADEDDDMTIECGVILKKKWIT